MNDINVIKDRIQREALNKWVKGSNLGSFIGCIEACTGSGKSRCGVLASQYVINKISDNAKILILSPSRSIRDKEWKEEFIKWKATSVYNNNVTTSCIQTAYKWKKKHFDLVIIDESHNILSEKFIEFCNNNTYDKLLALTATMPEDKKLEQNKYFPTVYKINIDKGVELGLVSNFVEYNLKCTLTNKEIIDYNKIQANYKYFENRLGGKRFAFFNASKIRKELLGKKSVNMTPQEKEKSKIAAGFWATMQKRKFFLYNIESKIDFTYNLVKQLNPDKAIVFFMSTSSADKFASKSDKILPYHSKIEAPEQHLRKFEDGRTKINILSCVEAANEGLNLKNLSFGIISTGTSSAKSHIQRRGRILRLQEDNDVATVINLYAPDTQEEKWLSKRQKTTPSKYIKWIDNIKEINY